MRYALNLPSKLKSDAEQLAAHQGVSLKQFIHLDADTSGLPDSPTMAGLFWPRKPC